jgi:hypothetical protein
MKPPVVSIQKDHAFQIYAHLRHLAIVRPALADEANMLADAVLTAVQDAELTRYARAKRRREACFAKKFPALAKEFQRLAR